MNEQKRELSREEMHKREKKKKKKVKKRLFWLKLFLFLVLTCGALVLLGMSPLFSIKSVEVSGNTRYKQEDVVAATDITIGNNGFKTIGGTVKNIFQLRYGNAEKTIRESFPYYKEVAVKFALPDKFRIVVTERIPMLLVPYMGMNVVIDTEGVMVERLDQAKKLSLPVAKGIEVQQAEMGQALQTENAVSISKIAEFLKAVQNSDAKEKTKLYAAITQVEVKDADNLLILFDNRLQVNFGKLKELDYKLKFFRQIYFEKLDKNARGKLDFTRSENPSFMPVIEE